MALIKSISGIRGTIGGKPGESLTPTDVVKFTAAFGYLIKEDSDQKRKVVVGRDARLSGPMISQLVTSTLQSLGIDVVDLGLSTTPTVEMAVVLEKADGGIIITASHNPQNWNALKLLNNKGEFISEEEGKKLLKIAEEGSIEFEEVNSLGTYRLDDSYLQKHIDLILKLPLVDREAIQRSNFSIVVDAVNSSGGIAVPQLLQALGVNTITCLYCEPTGVFPHNPEPLPENLTHISSEMQRGGFNLGIVVDPDVDRLALMCEDGTPFGEEYTLVAVADYVLKHKKGNTVSNLSSTQALRDITEKAGGQYMVSAVGEVNVVKAMKECSAVIGGEGNGGVIYPDLHYGRDALVGIALFLTHLAKFGKSTTLLRAQYPTYYISKNKIELTPDINLKEILEKVKERYSKQPFTTIDGLRIEFDKQWVHLRQSNTEPIIRIYAESDTQITADHLAKKFMADIKEIITSVS